MRAMPNWLKLALQLCAILLAAYLFVYLAVLVQFYGEDHWLPDKHLVISVLFTAVVFSAVIAEFKRSWVDGRFWLSVSALCFLHLLACAAAWKFIREWRTILYAVVSVAEIPLLCVALDALGFVPSGRIRSRRP